MCEYPIKFEDTTGSLLQRVRGSGDFRFFCDPEDDKLMQYINLDDLSVLLDEMNQAWWN